MEIEKQAITCPKCGQSFFQEISSFSTLVYYPPIFKDGVNINPDRNKITTTYECQYCGNKWTISNINEVK